MPFVVCDKGAQYKVIILVKFQSVVITWRVCIYPLDSQLTLQADKLVQLLRRRPEQYRNHFPDYPFLEMGA